MLTVQAPGRRRPHLSETLRARTSVRRTFVLDVPRLVDLAVDSTCLMRFRVLGDFGLFLSQSYIANSLNRVQIDSRKLDVPDGKWHGKSARNRYSQSAPDP